MNRGRLKDSLRVVAFDLGGVLTDSDHLRIVSALSFEANVVRPELAFYQLTRSLVGDQARVLYIDDVPESTRQGELVGFTGFQYSGPIRLEAGIQHWREKCLGH